RALDTWRRRCVESSYSLLCRSQPSPDLASWLPGWRCLPRFSWRIAGHSPLTLLIQLLADILNKRVKRTTAHDSEVPCTRDRPLSSSRGEARSVAFFRRVSLIGHRASTRAYLNMPPPSSFFIFSISMISAFATLPLLNVTTSVSLIFVGSRVFIFG